MVPFDDPAALQQAIDHALTTTWDRGVLRAHACNNEWSKRVAELTGEFAALKQAADSGSRRIGPEEATGG
jgi:hypothetical protein